MKNINYLCTIFLINAVFTSLPIDKSGKYYVSTDDITRICKSSALFNFPVDHTLLATYPLNEKLEQYINEYVHSFWQKIDKLNPDYDLNMRKRKAFELLTQKNVQMNSIIEKIEDKVERSLAYIIWGYALLVIHHQIVHYIQ